MAEAINITSERIDDVVLLLHVMIQMGLPEIRVAALTPALETGRTGLGMGSSHLASATSFHRATTAKSGCKNGWSNAAILSSKCVIWNCERATLAMTA